MADSIAYDLTGRVIGYLGQLAIDKVAPYFGGSKDQVTELAGTMRMIRARLGDAERRREGEDGEALKEWLRRLKNVLYKLEDLFEELSMADHERQQQVSLLTLGSCRLKMNKRLSQDVEDIMKEVKRIKSDMDLLNLRECQKIEHQGDVNMREVENYCFLLEEEVIGRDDDKEKIVEMLLDSHQRVSVIPIVGFGGLGKTTLVRLCYDDRNVQNHFEFKGWVCLSEISSVDDLLKKILKSITSLEDVDKLKMQELQFHLHEAVNGKKYLLVLDDIWDENRERWLHLRRLLSSGKQGSKIIVTSRSKVVADNMGTVEPFEVEGLSEEKSWALFRSLAFKEGQEERNPNLINIGREIVRKCGNVPLAIRTIASLLYSRDTEEEWLLLKDSKLRMMDPNENKIMSTLKLSYDHLPSPLKQCFTYCSLFPKGYVYNTEQLIWLWMAQGFIRPSDRNQRLEDIGHAYFMELWRRCFFQEVRRDQFGSIKDCKIHDLLYDLASKVGDECLLVIGSMEQDIDDGISHVNLIVDKYSSTFKAPSWFLRAKQMRSYLLYSRSLLPTRLNVKISTSLKSVRALILAGGYVQCLPNSIGELKHLRYLKVVVRSKYLPNGITRLQNLQTLDLCGSRRLRELPSGFSKLINLRHLLMSSTDMLFEMSPRFGELTSFQTLDKFVVGKYALGSMNLAGALKIYCGERRVNAMMANLKCKKLTYLELNWPVILGNTEIAFDSAKVLECLEPPPTLQCLRITGWEGEKAPSWGMNKFPCVLHNLVSVQII